MHIIRLMSRCDCRCSFCLVWDEIQSSTDLNLEELKSTIDQLSSDEPIDFFGGEPTLYPHFFELVSYARARGHECTLASHCMKAADFSFAERLSQLELFEIRTSIYGHTDEIHDSVTRRKGSRARTLAGISNLTTLGQSLSATIVITRQNADWLVEIVRTLAAHGCKKIKFSLLVQSDLYFEFVPNLSIVKNSLKVAINECDALNIVATFSKMPFCIFPDRVSQFVCEGEYEGVPGKPDLPICNGCLLGNWCHGLEPEYLAQPEQVLHPIMTIASSDRLVVTADSVNNLNVPHGPYLTLFYFNVNDKPLLSDFLLEAQRLFSEARRFEGSIGIISGSTDNCSE